MWRAGPANIDSAGGATSASAARYQKSNQPERGDSPPAERDALRSTEGEDAAETGGSQTRGKSTDSSACGLDASLQSVWNCHGAQ